MFWAPLTGKIPKPDVNNYLLLDYNTNYAINYALQKIMFVIIGVTFFILGGMVLIFQFNRLKTND